MTEAFVWLFVVGGLALTLSLALAPIESLGWWAGWLAPGPEEDAAAAPAAAPATAPAPPPDCFVVFLSGIGAISGDALLPHETAFLDRLQAELPEARIVRDVFPYAPSGRELLTGQRVFTWFWLRVREWRLNGTRLLPDILNLRNLFQVLVSADDRYGPLYGFGIAGIVRERLAAAGYEPRRPVQVVLLGSSGGGQISVGAATYLADALGEPPAIVTIGGVMCSDRGIEAASWLVSLFGSGDRVYALGRIAFPGRWPVAGSSFWNEARRDGRLVEREIGAMSHSGPGGYLDAAPRQGGRPWLDVTVAAVAAAIRDGLARPRPERGA
ncbi:hypothetical protein [Amaricoccus sp.]|uniref:hypothetical protein n=1 Tax=Amaricoccus sp. TaxID=1872485 RepID=UPI001B66D15A|nr:hypothetical protein [Amaricoccus sp.]MBP7241578.1 hypothetical protein [Amaricoccus sp.]